MDSCRHDIGTATASQWLQPPPCTHLGTLLHSPLVPQTRGDLIRKEGLPAQQIIRASHKLEVGKLGSLAMGDKSGLLGSG